MALRLLRTLRRHEWFVLLFASIALLTLLWLTTAATRGGPIKPNHDNATTFLQSALAAIEADNPPITVPSEEAEITAHIEAAIYLLANRSQ